MGAEVKEMRRGRSCGTPVSPLHEVSGNQRAMCRGGIGFDLTVSRPVMAATLRIYWMGQSGGDCSELDQSGHNGGDGTWSDTGYFKGKPGSAGGPEVEFERKTGGKVA